MTKLAELVAKPHPSARKEVRLLLESEDLSNEKKIDLGENDEIKVIIAAQQGTILATAFHPELTNDLRFHRYFARFQCLKEFTCDFNILQVFFGYGQIV